MSGQRWSDKTLGLVAGEVEDIVLEAVGEVIGRHDAAQAAYRLLAALADAGLLVEPDTWAIPPEPGPEVTAVLDCDGELWVRNAVDWHMHDVTCVPDCLTTPRHGSHSWAEVLSLFGPLAETSHPTAAAPASAAVPLSQPPTTAPGERGGVESPSASPP